MPHIPLVAKLTHEDKAELVALEMSIREIHMLATMSDEKDGRAAKSIRTIRMEAERGLKILRAVKVDELDQDLRRDYLLQFETMTRTLHAVNQRHRSRPM